MKYHKNIQEPYGVSDILSYTFELVRIVFGRAIFPTLIALSFVYFGSPFVLSIGANAPENIIVVLKAILLLPGIFLLLFNQMIVINLATGEITERPITLMDAANKSLGKYGKLLLTSILLVLFFCLVSIVIAPPIRLFYNFSTTVAILATMIVFFFAFSLVLCVFPIVTTTNFYAIKAIKYSAKLFFAHPYLNFLKAFSIICIASAIFNAFIKVCDFLTELFPVLEIPTTILIFFINGVTIIFTVSATTVFFLNSAYTHNEEYNDP